MPKNIYDYPKTPGKRLTTEGFIKRARKVHGDKYDYSKVKYINARTKVAIICPEHGEYYQRPSCHLVGQGCLLCSWHQKKKDTDWFIQKNKEHFAKKYNTEWFIQKATEVHGAKYDYSKVDYKNTGTKVIIICPIHGEFEQSPCHHLHGQGCPKCNRGGGIGRNRYEDKTPGILYCIKCKWKDDSGSFTKIGITDRSLFKRFPKQPTKKFPFRILEYFVADGEIGDMQRLEDKVKDQFLKYKYTPEVKFAGYTECFEVTEHDKIVRFIKKTWCG